VVNEQRAVIFHLKRNNGSSLFVHPFTKNLSTLSIEEMDQIEGSYGAEPRVESITALRNALYRQTESDIRDWIYERRFIPRFLISAASFVVTYFFLALVIRDPIPFVDEFVAATGVGILVYILLGRRYQQSKGAAEKRALIRERIDSVSFEEQTFIHDLETILHTIETGIQRGETDTLEAQLAEDVARIREEHPVEVDRFLSTLKERNLSRTEKKVLKAIRRGQFSPAFVNRNRINTSEIDPVLLESVLTGDLF